MFYGTQCEPQELRQFRQRGTVLQSDFLIMSAQVQYQCGFIWHRSYNTCSSITEEGKWSAAFNGSGLSLKAY